MSALTIDTLEVSRELQEAGLDARQAEGVSQAIRKAQEQNLGELATRGDLKATIELAEQRIIIRLGGLMIALFGLGVAWFELRGG